MGDPTIVVIGGGSGTSNLLSELKNEAAHLIALINTSDDGGSTGKLRQEYGVHAPGDIRQCIAALSDDPDLGDFLNYRFTEGGLAGHTVGNILLTALEHRNGDYPKALRQAQELFGSHGRVEPATLADFKLCLRTREGATSMSEYEIGHMKFDSPQPDLWLEPPASLNPEAVTAIEEADLLVVAPGNLYGSLAPVLLVSGFVEAVQASPAACVCVANLVNEVGQTDNFDVIDQVTELERMAGGQFIDTVIYNTGELPADVDAVLPPAELPDRYKYIAGDIVRHEERAVAAGDALAATRSRYQHDSAETARILVELAKSERFTEQ